MIDVEFYFTQSNEHGFKDVNADAQSRLKITEFTDTDWNFFDSNLFQLTKNQMKKDVEKIENYLSAVEDIVHSELSKNGKDEAQSISKEVHDLILDAVEITRSLSTKINTELEKYIVNTKRMLGINRLGSKSFDNWQALHAELYQSPAKQQEWMEDFISNINNIMIAKKLKPPSILVV